MPTPTDLTFRLERALQAKFGRGYHVGIVANGARYDRIVIRNRASGQPHEPFMYVDRKTGDVSKPDRSQPWSRAQRAGGSTGPVVRYRAAEEQEFARLVADADPWGDFLTYSYVPEAVA